MHQGTMRVAAALFGGFLALLVVVNLGVLRGTDSWLTEIIQAPRDCGLLTLGDFAAIPFSIEGSVVLCVLATLVLCRAGCGLLSIAPWLLILPTLLEVGGKLWIDQPEPPVPTWTILADCASWFHTLDVPTANSFPSGHAIRMSYLGALLVGLVRDRWRRVLIGLSVGIAVAVLAWARVYPGFHWPTDVVGGILLGTASALPVMQVLSSKVNARLAAMQSVTQSAASTDRARPGSTKV